MISVPFPQKNYLFSSIFSEKQIRNFQAALRLSPGFRRPCAQWTCPANLLSLVRANCWRAASRACKGFGCSNKEEVGESLPLHASRIANAESPQVPWHPDVAAEKEKKIQKKMEKRTAFLLKNQQEIICIGKKREECRQKMYSGGKQNNLTFRKLNTHGSDKKFVNRGSEI